MVTATLKSRVESLIAMAQLLERVDANPAGIGAAQYQKLAQLVQSLLSEDVPGEAMQAVMSGFPATAFLYENLHYDRSGLSRSPLDRAVSSERLASQLIERVRAGNSPKPT